MTGKDLLLGLGNVSEIYIEEAGADQPGRARPWLAPAALAACLALLLAAGMLLPGRQGHVVLPPDGGQPPVTDGGGGETVPPPAVDDRDQSPEEGPLVITMENVALNGLGVQLDTSRLWPDPEKYDELRWTLEDVTAYYGRDPFPAYVPEGLSGGAAAEDARWTVYAAKDGTLWEDTVGCVYAAGFWPDGGAVSGALGGKTVRVSCSRLGLLTDCIYLLPENEVKTTDIFGAAVTFGYRQMSHGSYDPDTHEPAGYFDLYTAEFTLEGTEYGIVTEGLPAEEIVKVAASVVTGRADVEAG